MAAGALKCHRAPRSGFVTGNVAASVADRLRRYFVAERSARLRNRSNELVARRDAMEFLVCP